MISHLQDEPHVAAIDLGSHTCRILIARLEDDGKSHKVVDSLARVVRLGAGVRDTGLLSTEGMDRSIQAIKDCARKLQKYNIVGLRSVATEACRQAKNAQEFLRRVTFETGIELEIIPEFEEGQLALLGCNMHIDPATPYLLAFDIGGCSTEVMWAKVEHNNPPKVQDWMSVPFGVVNVVEAAGGSPSIFYTDIRERIQKELHQLSRYQEITALVGEHNVQMIGTSGTTTTVTAIHLDLPVYDRFQVDGTLIPLMRIHEIGKKLADMTPRQLAQHACIGPSRSDLIIGGMAILEGICDCWPVKDLKVADRGVRDGILHALREQQLKQSKITQVS
ncbi:MAG: Ppx/GppA family phosphatase [Pseudomonadota bacterium]